MRTAVKVVVWVAFCTLLVPLHLCASEASSARLIWSFATFDKTPIGWRCSRLDPAKTVGPFRHMREGDVLTAVGGRSVVSASLIDLITSLRRTQLGVDSEATVLRGDKHVLLHSSAVHSEPRYFHLVTALVSAKILLSDLPGIVAGDRLVSIGNQSWSAMTANLLSQGIPLAETRFPSGAKVVAESNARARPVMAKLPIVLHIMSFPPASHPDLLAIILHGVRGGDISVSDVKGHWACYISGLLGVHHA